MEGWVCACVSQVIIDGEEDLIFNFDREARYLQSRENFFLKEICKLMQGNVFMVNQYYFFAG